MPEENYQGGANALNKKQPAAEHAPAVARSSDGEALSHQPTPATETEVTQSAGNPQTAENAETSQAEQKRKLFCIYDFAGGDEGGVSPKGLGIFILCATAVIAAFFIIASLQ